MAFTEIPTLYTQRLVLMQKVGLLYEGCRRQHTFKWGEYRDIKLYSMLRGDWQKT